MKKTILSIAAFLFAASSISFGQEIKLETTTIDYGTITQKVDGVREFKFTNVGDAPLVIHNAQQSCGCTVPSWPKDPIMPGESSVIKVKYDTNRLGSFSKYVTLTTNDLKNTSTRLSIKGNVVVEEEATPAKEKTVFE